MLVMLLLKFAFVMGAIMRHIITMIVGSPTMERKDVDEATVNPNTAGLFILLLVFSTIRRAARVTMVVVMVVTVLDIDQRPTERLSEAVTNLNRLYLDPVHEDSDLALFAMAAWAMTETLGRVAGRNMSLLSRKRKVGNMSGRGRETRRRRMGEIQEFTVAIILAIGGHGLNSMTETNATERRILFNGRSHNKETYRCSAHMSWNDMSERCRCSNDSKS